MKFSLFLEMQVDGTSGISDFELYKNCVEQVVFADQLGYHAIWEVEHHGLYEYSHSSAPETFLAYVAAKTKKIRLGHGITLSPGKFNHPIRIAERVATLDILSEGRVNWGSGKSSSNVEAETFGINFSDLKGQWLEALDIVPSIWQNEIFSWNGTYYKIPPVCIRPKPVQRPHPPMFAPSASIESALEAGALGLGLLSFSQQKYDDLTNRVGLYRQAIRNSEPRLYNKNEYFAVTSNAIVLDDDHSACEYGFRGGRFFWESLQQYYSNIRPAPELLPVERRPIVGSALAAAKIVRNRNPDHLFAIIGDPVHAREKVAMFQKAGVDELILAMQLGTVPHEVVMKSIRCFAEKVMPHFL